MFYKLYEGLYINLILALYYHLHIELSYLLLVVSQEHAMTTTSAVTADTITIALLCSGVLNANYTNLVMQATGRGMSALVLS